MSLKIILSRHHNILNTYYYIICKMKSRSTLTLLISSLIFYSFHAFNINRFQTYKYKLYSSSYGASDQYSDDDKFWRENIQYVDLTSSIIPPTENARELPLFLLGNAFYPEGNTYLHVFEMKYRTMMFDVSQKDDIFGYIHSEGGQIASVGTLCKITNKQLLDDGRQFIELEGIGRFRVRKIVKTLPVIIKFYDTKIKNKF